MIAQYTIGRAVHIPGGEDSDGYPRPEDWGDIDPLQVFGWQPLASTMPVDVELSHRVVTSKLLLVPDVAPYHPLDKVWLSGTVVDGVFVPTDSDDFLWVNEDVRDFSTGPFGFNPGGSVVLEKVRG